jgi:hypothetical protein
MNVGTICQRLVINVRRADEVVRAAELMRSKHVGYLVVVEADKAGALRPVGVLTDRDIVVAVVAREIDPRTLHVGDIMTIDPVTVGEKLQAGSGAQREYAQHFLSGPGAHDGLYWPVAAGETESPLGPLMAQARAEGYETEPGGGKPHLYYGYFYRILTRQGAHAPGGAHSYIVAGRMTEGFGLLAYPARYGDSGLMTFIVNQDGIVFQKNLGPQTAAMARAIDQYDPDSSWTAP